MGWIPECTRLQSLHHCFWTFGEHVLRVVGGGREGDQVVSARMPLTHSRQISPISLREDDRPGSIVFLVFTKFQ